jgi:hypothetical protein
MLDHFRRIAILTIAACAIAQSTSALAVAPNWNSDIAGAPRIAVDEPAALSITVRTCPAGYDPTTETADYLADCQEPAGDTNFQVSLGAQTGPSASTGTSGDAPQQSTVQFSQLVPGSYTIAATAPPEIDSAFIGACASDQRSFADYPIAPFAWVAGGRVTLTLRSGESLACDWYQIQGSESAS